MAIRIGPPPVLARLRLHWHTTRNYYLRYFRTVNSSTQFGADRAAAWWRKAYTTASARLLPRARAYARRKMQCACFIEHYEDLVELLCWAAKDGDHTDRDVRYARIRHWMQLNYHKIRPYLRPHLEAWQGPFDPFEELFAPECIDEVINDSDAIANFMRTRVALETYRAALETADTIH